MDIKWERHGSGALIGIDVFKETDDDDDDDKEGPLLGDHLEDTAGRLKYNVAETQEWSPKPGSETRMALD